MRCRVFAEPGSVLLLLLLVLGVPPGHAIEPVPSREELLDKSSKELKGLLRSRGASCKKCLEKDDLVDRLIQTWDWTPTEAVSPDGKIRMTKEMFAKNLETNYRKHLSEQRAHVKAQSEGHALANEDEEEEQEEGEQVPDLDKVWLDFSERLRTGEIKTDEKGSMIYEVANGPGREQSFLDKYKTQLMVSINVVILWFMQHVRGKEREMRKNEERDKPLEGPKETKPKKGGGGKAGGHKDKAS